MKNYSMNPKDENVIQMFRLDSVGRNDEIIRFIELLDIIKYGFSIALNGEWGSGKTFFVKQLKLILDFNNPRSDMNEETKNAVKSVVSSLKCECSESYATVYYDAWANDNTEDPILSLLYATIKANKDIKPENEKNISKILISLIDTITGRDLSKLRENIIGENIFETIQKEEDIQQLVAEFFDNLIIERANRLVIFIDELDRCKPAYAIQLLERIKHYFNDDRVIFVFSVNISQLQHTIKSYYGVGFNATAYLDKFFDLRMSLPEINYDLYINKRFDFMQSSHIFDEICVHVIKYFKFSLREVERFLRLTRIAYRRDKAQFYNEEEKAHIFALMYIAPIAIGLSMKDIKTYNNFITGSYPDILYKILVNSERTSISQFLLADNEWFSDDKNVKASDIVVSLEERLNEVYTAMFPKISSNYGNPIRIGKISFSPRTRIKFNKIISLLSPFCNYQFE